LMPMARALRGLLMTGSSPGAYRYGFNHILRFSSKPAAPREHLF